MAMIDYGAIAWKDGKLISTNMFTPMEDMVGWSDNSKHRLDGYCFAFIGDKDLTLGFYKDVISIYSATDDCYNDTHYFCGVPFEGWHRWREWCLIGPDADVAEIIVRPRRFHDYYICKMKYRGHKYKVAFGYGVDLKYYKKTHIIDYYGTPWSRVKSICDDIKFNFRNWKWRKGL